MCKLSKLATWTKETHIVRAEHLSIGGVFQQQPFEPQDFGDSFLGSRRKVIDLNLVQVVIADDLLQNGVKFIKDLGPCIEIRAWPKPCLHV